MAIWHHENMAIWRSGHYGNMTVCQNGQTTVWQQTSTATWQYDNMAATAEPYIGKYYSQNYVRNKILRQTDQEIIEQDILIAKEIEAGIIADPNAPIDPETGQPMTPTAGDSIDGDSGSVPTEPEMDTSGLDDVEV